jgi:GAF domain-containing protein
LNADDGRRTPDRRGRLDAVLAVIMGQPAGPLSDMVCSAAAQRLHAPGVGITIAVSDELLQGAHATTLGRTGDGLQEELGEGPAYAAHLSGRPVLVADLAEDDRWPAFARAAGEVGIVASFSFPIGSGAVKLGTLNLYRPSAVPLDDEQHADGLIFARLALDLLTAPPELDGQVGSSSAHAWPGAASLTPQLHQATGMVSAQLGVDMADALAALRAHTYATGRPLTDLSADVVARKLRLHDDP